MREIATKNNSSNLRLRLLPAGPGKHGIGIEPAFTVWDNTQARIRHAVEEKKNASKQGWQPLQYF
jgi:hypothetical protein